MKNKLNILSFVEIFTKHLLILIIFTALIFIPTFFIVGAKAKLNWNIKFNVHQNDNLVLPYISSVLEYNKKKFLKNRLDIENYPFINKSYFDILKEISKHSTYVVAQNLRNNDIQFSVAKNKLNNDQFGSFVSINVTFPAELGTETEIKKYLKKMEKQTSVLLTYLLKMEYEVDLKSSSDENLLNFRIKSMTFIDNKNLLILKSFLVCLAISYSIIFIFVNRKKIRFI